MSKAAPQQKREIATPPGSPSLAQASDARRGANARYSPVDLRLLAADSSNDSSAAANPSSFFDFLLYLIHGLALLLLALWALYHFGQVFWFFSTVMALIGMFSLHNAYAAFRRSLA
jgi:hypothetical protein